MNRLIGAMRALLLVVGGSLLASGVAGAEMTTLAGAAPIVRIQIPTQVNLTIRTWNRHQVQVDGDTSQLSIVRGTQQVPDSLQPALIRMAEVAGHDGNMVVLPAESFVVSTLPAGRRDVVRVSLATNPPKHALGNVTVSIPNDTPVVIANVARGEVTLRDYRTGTFIVHVHTGSALLQNVGGDGFVQVLRGFVVASDSNFDRLRVRTALASAIFQHCRAKQIEVSSVGGQIIYDDGSFAQGLARFDSGSGNVAVGVTSGSHLDARTGSGGHVFTMFDRHTQVDSKATQASATFDGGGPIVNATSVSGNVYLYDGALASKRSVPADWRAALLALHPDNDGSDGVPYPAYVPSAATGGSAPNPPPSIPSTRHHRSNATRR